MKKIIILCSAIFLFVLSTKAQTFTFYRGDIPLGNNAEFTVSKTSLDEFDALVIESGLRLKNLTNTAVEAGATQTILTAPPDESYGVLNFCFERCQEGNVNQSQKKTIEPNILMSPPDFHLCYFPFDENYTTVKVKYEVFPLNDISGTDKATVTVTYIYDANSTAIASINTNPNTIKVLQTEGNVSFYYAPEANLTRLAIYAVTGQQIGSYALTYTKGSFTLPEKPDAGVYVCNFSNAQGKLTTKKLLITY